MSILLPGKTAISKIKAMYLVVIDNISYKVFQPTIHNLVRPDSLTVVCLYCYHSK